MKFLPFDSVDKISYVRDFFKPTISNEMADYTQYYEYTRIETHNIGAIFDHAYWN